MKAACQGEDLGGYLGVELSNTAVKLKKGYLVRCGFEKCIW